MGARLAPLELRLGAALREEDESVELLAAAVAKAALQNAHLQPGNGVTGDDSDAPTG